MDRERMLAKGSLAAGSLARIAMYAARGAGLEALPTDELEAHFLDSVLKAFDHHRANPRLAIIEACNLIATWASGDTPEK